MSSEEAGPPPPPPRAFGSVDSDSDTTSAIDNVQVGDEQVSIIEKRRLVARTASVNELEALKREWDESNPASRGASRVLSLAESIPLSFNDGKSSFKSFIRTGTVEPLDEDFAVIEIPVDSFSETPVARKSKRSHITLPNQHEVVYVSGSAEEASEELSSDNQGREPGKKRTLIPILSQKASTEVNTTTDGHTQNATAKTKGSDGTTNWSSSSEEQLLAESWEKTQNVKPHLRKSNPFALIPKGFVLRRRAILDKSLSSQNLPKVAGDVTFKESTIGIRPEHIPDGMVWSKRANKGRGGLVYIRPLPGAIPKGMKWSLTANKGMGGLINIPPAEEDIPRGFGWSATAKEGRGALVRLPPEDIPDGMEWNPEADNGMGALVNIRPDAKDIPAGKRWSYSANAGLGGLVDAISRDFGSSNSARRRRRAMLQPFETGNAVNEIRDSDVVNVRRSQRERIRKGARRHKKLRKPFRRRRNTRNEPLNLEDWGIIVEEEDNTGLQGVDLSTADEANRLSRKSLFDMWRQSIPNDFLENENEAL